MPRRTTPSSSSRLAAQAPREAPSRNGSSAPERVRHVAEEAEVEALQRIDGDGARRAHAGVDVERSDPSHGDVARRPARERERAATAEPRRGLGPRRRRRHDAEGPRAIEPARVCLPVEHAAQANRGLGAASAPSTGCAGTRRGRDVRPRRRAELPQPTRRNAHAEVTTDDATARARVADRRGRRHDGRPRQAAIDRRERGAVVRRREAGRSAGEERGEARRRRDRRDVPGGVDDERREARALAAPQRDHVRRVDRTVAHERGRGALVERHAVDQRAAQGDANDAERAPLLDALGERDRVGRAHDDDRGRASWPRDEADRARVRLVDRVLDPRASAPARAEAVLRGALAAGLKLQGPSKPSAPVSSTPTKPIAAGACSGSTFSRRGAPDSGRRRGRRRRLDATSTASSASIAPHASSGDAPGSSARATTRSVRRSTRAACPPPAINAVPSPRATPVTSSPATSAAAGHARSIARRASPARASGGIVRRPRRSCGVEHDVGSVVECATTNGAAASRRRPRRRSRTASRARPAAVGRRPRVAEDVERDGKAGVDGGGAQRARLRRRADRSVGPHDARSAVRQQHHAVEARHPATRRRVHATERSQRTVEPRCAST